MPERIAQQEGTKAANILHTLVSYLRESYVGPQLDRNPNSSYTSSYTIEKLWIIYEYVIRG